MSGGKLDLPRIVDERESERGTLHSRHLNEQLVRVLKTIGFDVGFKRGQGQYLYDRNDQRYLDLLSGFGVFAIGRNHPVLRDTLKSVLDSDLPNLVQMDVSVLAGILAERLLGLRAVSRQGVLRELRHRMRRGCDQVCARRDRPPRHPLHGARLSRAVLRIAVADRRQEFPQRF